VPFQENNYLTTSTSHKLKVLSEVDSFIVQPYVDNSLPIGLNPPDKPNYPDSPSYSSPSKNASIILLP